MKIAVPVLISLGLTACSAKPISNSETGNADVTVGIIARVGGCDLYRVRDGNSQTVYVTVCPPSRTQTIWDENCGKGCRTTRYALAVQKE